MKKILYSLIVLFCSNILHTASPVNNKHANEEFLSKASLPDNRRDKIERLKELLDQGIITQETLDKALLHSAAGNLQVKTIKFLVENGANVNVTDKEGNTPLIEFLFDAEIYKDPEEINKVVEIIKELVFHGASTNITNKAGETAQSLFAKLDPKIKKEIENVVNQYLAKRKKGIEEATGLPTELTDLTAQQLFGELKSTPKVAPKNHD